MNEKEVVNDNLLCRCVYNSNAGMAVGQFQGRVPLPSIFPFKIPAQGLLHHTYAEQQAAIQQGFTHDCNSRLWESMALDFLLVWHWLKEQRGGKAIVPHP